MNKLGKLQKKIRDYTFTKEQRSKNELIFNEMYFKLRAKEEKRFLSTLSLETKRKIHPIILLIYKIKNKIGGFSYELIKDNRKDLMIKRPIIYAVTHVGKFDIEVISESAGDHYYLLSGDYEHLQGTIDAPFLAMNGVFYFNEKNKEDRKMVVKKMINLLHEGGNIMYFPEGTWNLSPNLIVLPCYWGIIDVAKQGNAIIIPIAAEQYGKHFKIIIGSSFDVSYFGNSKKEKLEAITILRDLMASMKYEIWESMGVSQRAQIKNDYWEEYKKQRFAEWPAFDMEYIDSMVLKPKINS